MEQLFEMKKTQVEMVQDRGYDIPEEELQLLDMSFRQFLSVNSEISRDELSQVYSFKGTPQLMVNYLNRSQDSKQISTEVVRLAIDQAKSLKLKELIIVIEIPLSSKAKEDLTISGLKHQVFFDKDLSYNPTRHVDSPRHELLTPTEAEEKLKELRADIGKLLIIKSTDPIVQYYNWPIGGIVRVYREDFGVSILAPKSVNYRVISV